MSSTAMRTPAKVQSLRAHEIDGGEKNAGSQTHLARAVTLHLAGKREEALKQLQRAIAANEASAEIYRAMGHIQFELGNFEEAAKSYRILAQVKPQYAMGWFNLAVCLERAGAWEDAAQAFHRACHAGRRLRGCAPRSRCLPSAPGGSQVRPVQLQSLPGAESGAPGGAVRQGGGAAIARSSGRGVADLSEDSGAQSRFRRIALQPDSDRHGEGRFRHGAGVLRAPARTAAGIHGGAGRSGVVGLRGGRARAHGEVLHPAGERRAGSLRRLVQPGAGASEIGALRAGVRSL